MDYDEAKVKIGNILLLEPSINKSLGNQVFLEKVQKYGNSSYYLNRSIAKIENVGKDTSINRINKKLKSFDTWNAQTINERQDMLAELVKEIIMPSSKSGNQAQ